MHGVKACPEDMNLPLFSLLLRLPSAKRRQSMRESEKFISISRQTYSCKERSLPNTTAFPFSFRGVGGHPDHSRPVFCTVIPYTLSLLYTPIMQSLGTDQKGILTIFSKPNKLL